MKSLHILLVFILSSSAWATLPGKIIHDVPDANQPPPSNQPAWCVPMAAVNIIDYWANVKCVPGAYGLLGANPPEMASEDIGWFCNTNGNGSPYRTQHPFLGTYSADVQPGIDEFIKWDLYHLFSNPNPVLPGKTSAEWIFSWGFNGFSDYKDEVDQGRPALLTFFLWDIVLSDSVKDPSLQETVYVYRWNSPHHHSPQIPGAPEELWGQEEGIDSPGHDVTGYGYWENFDPDNSGTPENWAIVRDNWACTPKAVAVPWNYFWNSTIRINISHYLLDIPFTSQPYQLDGLVTLFERQDARAFQLHNSNAAIYVRATNQQTLYFALFNTKTTPSQLFEYRLCFDPLHDRGSSPKPDDVQIIVKTDGSKSEFVGDSVNWSSVTPSGWDAAMNTPALTGQFSIEMEIDYAKIGLYRGHCDTLGFSIWEHATDIVGWPSASSATVPCAWGDMMSTDCFTPVELVSFNAQIDNRDVLLFWRTASESNNLGFEIQRASDGNPFAARDFVNGAGTTNMPQTYRWQEENLQPGAYEYRLKQIDTDGAELLYEPLQVSIAAPESFVVHPAMPNPFNNSTRIRFQLSRESRVRTDIFSMDGRVVKKLTDNIYKAGYHSISWDGRDESGAMSATGLYFCRIYTASTTCTLKLLLVK
ncbi:T9SS type A sorting domain-containing protein [candidate division KSB1 bacterium]|nr:T9SS type A sorting domain-containing protein [candidate division KSB1 bacterium]